MFGVLFDNLEILSNQKSFKIQINTLTDLWILLHLRDLTIVNSDIHYQREKFYKKEPYPIRKLTKKFENTKDLLAYINNQRFRYNWLLRKFSLDFSNGWNVRISGFHITLEFTTNSTEERNDLINKLIKISGIDPINCDELIPNVGYMISLDDYHLKSFSNVPHPDQFWTEEQVERWRKWYLANEGNQGVPF